MPKKCLKNKKVDIDDYMYWAKEFGTKGSYSNFGYDYGNREYGTKIIDNMLYLLRKCKEDNEL